MLKLVPNNPDPFDTVTVNEIYHAYVPVNADGSFPFPIGTTTGFQCCCIDGRNCTVLTYCQGTLD